MGHAFTCPRPWRIGYGISILTRHDRDPDHNVRASIDRFPCPAAPPEAEKYPYQALAPRSEEHTSAHQSLMLISSPVFCSQKQTYYNINFLITTFQYIDFNN